MTEPSAEALKAARKLSFATIKEIAVALDAFAAQAVAASMEAIIAADKIETLDVFTSDRWTERRELTAHARSVIALALDAFAAQAVVAERERCAQLIFRIRDKQGRSLDWCNALNALAIAIRAADDGANR